MEIEPVKTSPEIQQQPAPAPPPEDKRQARASSEPPVPKKAKAPRNRSKKKKEEESKRSEEQDSNGSSPDGPSGCFGMLKRFTCSLQCGKTTCSLQETVESEASTSVSGSCSSPDISPTASTQSLVEELPPPPPAPTGAIGARKRKSPPTKREPTTYKRAARRPKKAREAEASADNAGQAEPTQQMRPD